MNLNWIWEKQYKNIRIFLGNDPVGILYDAKGDSKVLKNQVNVERQGLLGQHVFFVDPFDDKAYYQYDYNKFTSTDKVYQIIDNCFYEVSIVNFKNHYRKLVELKISKNFFENYKNKGEIIVYDQENAGVNIFCLFYCLEAYS